MAGIQHTFNKKFLLSRLCQISSDPFDTSYRTVQEYHRTVQILLSLLVFHETEFQKSVPIFLVIFLAKAAKGFTNYCNCRFSKVLSLTFLFIHLSFVLNLFLSIHLKTETLVCRSWWLELRRSGRCPCPPTPVSRASRRIAAIFSRVAFNEIPRSGSAILKSV